jgi:diguanylate cyclase (GGDEF)-like protein
MTLPFDKDLGLRWMRVFLCHASEDKARARLLYRDLKAQGFAPWLDEEDLLPGQDWELEIQKAVRRSDAIVVCMSVKAVSKEGFVQKEIKYALDIADEKPEGTIFIIPVKLEPCVVPTRLARWQWIDLDDDGFTRVVQSLASRSDALRRDAAYVGFVDRLTNLASRRTFNERASDLTASKTPCVIALLSFDRFRRINERFGHTVGDRFLATVGLVLTKHLPPADLLARFGGDEFAVIFCGTSPQEVVESLNGLPSIFTDYIRHSDLPNVDLTFSGGVSSDRVEPMASKIEDVDRMVFEAKKQGGNVVRMA